MGLSGRAKALIGTAVLALGLGLSGLIALTRPAPSGPAPAPVVAGIGKLIWLLPAGKSYGKTGGGSATVLVAVPGNPVPTGVISVDNEG
jgi:hypothetical protein